MLLNPATTALVLIDLQRGIVTRDTKPHTAAEVVERASELAARFRAAGAAVVLVHVAFSADDRDRLKPPADGAPPVTLPIPPEFSELVPDLRQQSSDIGGIATNFGVESTARDAWERSYELVFVEDAMASFTEESHQFAITTIFPRLGRVRSTAEVLESLGSS